jgi:hypothetical protein
LRRDVRSGTLTEGHVDEAKTDATKGVRAELCNTRARMYVRSILDANGLHWNPFRMVATGWLGIGTSSWIIQLKVSLV